MSTEPQPDRVMTSWAFAKLLVEAGIFTQEQINRTKSVVIYAREGHPVLIRSERFGEDGELSRLIQSLEGLTPGEPQPDPDAQAEPLSLAETARQVVAACEVAGLPVPQTVQDVAARGLPHTSDCPARTNPKRRCRCEPPERYGDE